MIQVTAEKPAHGGTVIARHDGRVVFVRGALPGESDITVLLDDPDSTKSFLTGQAIAIGHESPHRVANQCPAAAQGAGCCDLDFVDAAGSLEFKKSVVLDQLSRIGKFDIAHMESNGIISATSLGKQQQWRTRVRFGVDDNGVIGQRLKGSREVISAANAMCAQLHPLLRDGILSELAVMAQTNKLPPHCDVVVAVGDDAEPHNLTTTRTVISRKDTQRVKTRGSQRSKGRNQKRGQQTVRTVLSSSESIVKRLKVSDRTLEWTIPGDAFWQAHEQATQAYADWIDQLVPSASTCSSAWDLYGGAGVFASVLRTKTADGDVTVVDNASAATAAGQQVLTDRVNFVTGDVKRVLDGPALAEADNSRPLHAVVLDPPRNGAGEDVVRLVANAAPQHVIHIGCDPATAARDLRYWVDQGYDIRALHVVDAFGLTHHVELLAYLVPRQN